MRTLKQGTVAVALVASLGLVMPGSLGGPVFADRDVTKDLTVQCDALGDTVYQVTATDHEPSGNLATLQLQGSTLVLVPQQGTITTVYTAIEPDDPEAAIPLPANDPSLGGNPVSFEIPPDHPYAYLGGEFSRGGAKPNKKNLIDCVVVDDSPDNYYAAEQFDVDGDSRFVLGVTYHYTDTYAIKAVVSGGRAGAKAASADGAQSADRQHKAKKGGKHRGKGKRGR
jgi:hypothetical protein